MNNSSDNSDDGKNEVVQINYYELSMIEKGQLLNHVERAAAALNAKGIKDSKNGCEFVQKIFDNTDVVDFLIYLSRLPVFNKEF